MVEALACPVPTGASFPGQAGGRERAGPGAGRGWGGCRPRAGGVAVDWGWLGRLVGRKLYRKGG